MNPNPFVVRGISPLTRMVYLRFTQRGFKRNSLFQAALFHADLAGIVGAFNGLTQVIETEVEFNVWDSAWNWRAEDGIIELWNLGILEGRIGIFARNSLLPRGCERIGHLGIRSNC